MSGTFDPTLKYYPQLQELVAESFAGHKNEDGLVFFDQQELFDLLKEAAALASPTVEQDFREQVLELCKQAEEFPGPPGRTAEWLIEQIRELPSPPIVNEHMPVYAPGIMSPTVEQGIKTMGEAERLYNEGEQRGRAKAFEEAADYVFKHWDTRISVAISDAIRALAQAKEETK